MKDGDQDFPMLPAWLVRLLRWICRPRERDTEEGPPERTDASPADFSTPANGGGSAILPRQALFANISFGTIRIPS